MRRLAWPLVAILFSVSLTSVASASGPVTFGFGGGITMPTNGTGDVLKNGFHLRGLAEMHVPALPFGLRGALGYQKMDVKDALQAASGFTNGQSQILSGLAGMTLPLMSTGPIRPYITASLGAFHVKGEADSSGVTVSNTQTHFGIDGGAGVKFGLGRAQGFVEARIENVYTDAGWNPAVSSLKSARFIPVTFGFSF
jgi:outer membrane protein with beta-barrel domain